MPHVRKCPTSNTLCAATHSGVYVGRGKMMSYLYFLGPHCDEKHYIRLRGRIVYTVAYLSHIARYEALLVRFPTLSRKVSK